MKFKDAVDNAVKMLSSPEFIERVKEEDDKMLRHLGILKEINSHGYITTESQGGHMKRGISFIDKKQYQMNEKAYIVGFLLESKAPQFLKNMSMHTDKNAIYVPGCDDNVYLPSKLDIPVTIEIKDNKSIITTHASSALPFSVMDSYREQLHINKKEKIVFILCWDSKWNRDASGPSGLFTEVLKILKSLDS